jgi:hypothetical protein
VVVQQGFGAGEMVTARLRTSPNRVERLVADHRGVLTYRLRVSAGIPSGANALSFLGLGSPTPWRQGGMVHPGVPNHSTFRFTVAGH